MRARRAQPHLISMHASIVLCGDDHARLLDLLNHECPGPWPAPEQAAALKKLADVAQVAEDQEILDSRVSLGDQVALVSVSDPGDFFSLQVVLPCEANVDLDRIPVTLPISQAVLGRRTHDVVTWETARETREMRIVAVKKCARPTLAG